jgi:hypothetical protein
MNAQEVSKISKNIGRISANLNAKLKNDNVDINDFKTNLNDLFDNIYSLPNKKPKCLRKKKEKADIDDLPKRPKNPLSKNC